MNLDMQDIDEVMFVGSLFLFYTHWLNDRRSAATSALEDAVTAHRGMGDERAQRLAKQLQELIEQAVTQEQDAIRAEIHGETEEGN